MNKNEAIVIPSVFEAAEFTKVLECCQAPLSWGIHYYYCEEHPKAEKKNEDDIELPY